MKNPLCVLACCLLAGGAAGAEPAPPDICSTRYVAVDAAHQAAAMKVPIDEAVATLDNSHLALPSPSLAGGTVTYLAVAPNFVEDLDKICVLGYFELARGAHKVAIPLVVDHLETIKSAHPNDETQAISTARIYFRVPRVDAFRGAGDVRESWKFWAGHQPLTLRIAAFAYGDGRRGTAYFGRDLKITVSAKRPSIVAAALFAAAFYLVAAATTRAGAGGAGWRGAANRLLPWYITGSSGQASLSQLQMLLFTLIVSTLLFYQWLRTGLLQQLSTDLLYLIGISTAGAAASQVTASIKAELDPPIYQYAQRLGWFTAPLAGAHRQARAAELLMTGERFDIYKFQMLAFTFVVAAYVIASGADELGDIQISSTLLALMGMSQGAYVGGRAASDTLTPLQDQLRGMQDLQERYRDSADPELREQLRRRFREAAVQASAMFGAIFSRAIPDELLDMPADAGEQ